ncbi:TIGR01244 family sulfur transferase [Frigidibacter sp. ROC022]|uniref:TIGR01244 family sulfur transferase n=1 Tax=Frigidibacter sp. ROC022 TaxID=2971796 RepID=UPI00215B5628|nr:TIGR01244 family sulfur transferase [Frigidibacter sp. ROC022]MCR8723238.1 TIGR01244 family sulfur transferase [Frigidibacter sp. ROC022]
MEIRELVPGYAVAPQIEASDMAEVAAAGFGTVICNRPDAENPAERASDRMRAAAEEHGLVFIFNPVMPGQITSENITLQGQALSDADKPVFAYCASGNRSSVVWALSQAALKEADELIRAAAKWGYQLEALRPHLEALARG